MKTFFFLLIQKTRLSALAVGSFAILCGPLAASAAESAPSAQKPVRILASFYPMYVMALNIAGDIPGVQVECLTEPFAGCLHDYSLTTGNMKKLAKADIFVANGAGMESFLDKALGQNPSLRIIEASKGIKLAHPGNAHVWVSISGAIEQTQSIARQLAEVDPAHAADYRRNADAYCDKLKALRAEMRAGLDGIKNRDIITFHEAFPYFASEFNLRIVGVIEREPGSEPNARELAETVQTIKKHNVRALFAEPQYPAKCAKVIERETGVPVGILDPAVTGPMEPAKARDSYLEAMRANLATLRKALAN